MKKQSTNQKGLWTASYGEIGATLKALQDNGVTLKHLARLRSEPEYAKRVAEYILRGGVEDSMHNKLARVLMDNNFFGIEDWIAFYEINFSKEQLCRIPEFPWDEDDLTSFCQLCGKTIKDCHFAFLGLDQFNGDLLTILKLQELYPAISTPTRFGASLYAPRERFAIETTMNFRWYLLHANIIPKSEKKTYEEQKAMLPAIYEVPSAVTEVAKNILILRKTGGYNSSRYARCVDIASNGDRVHVGHFELNNLVVIRHRPNNHRDCNIGIAASQKIRV